VSTDIQQPIRADTVAGRATRRSGAVGVLRAMGWPGLIVALFVLVAIIGPWIAPFDPRAIGTSALDTPPFSHGHLLGTDALGRDLLSRVLWGARPSFMTAMIPIVVATVVGTALGTLASFGPGWLGFTIMRGTDIAFAFPSVMLAIAIAAMLGPSLEHTIIAMSIVLVPPVARVARAAALEVSARPYIEAARLSGASQRRIVVHFALPNMIPPILVFCSTLTGLLIIFAAGLSFIGVGVQPPRAEWGLMVAEGRSSLLFNVWSSLIPGTCIFIVSMAFNFSADRLRDYLDPHVH
jgi:peptide/nickel transport system permease protein